MRDIRRRFIALETGSEGGDWTTNSMIAKLKGVKTKHTISRSKKEDKV